MASTLRKTFLLATIAVLPVLWLHSSGKAAPTEAGPLANPIMFVTQVPIPADFATVGSVFANHLGAVAQTGRGGDLWIRYPDGTLRNLTAEAGFGVDGFQGANSIAVRNPAVHWNGQKAVLSMVIGAPVQQFVWEQYFWQLYEVTGFDAGGTVSITKVAGQPTGANNVSPVYASDGRILFVSDRPRGGEPHLYPQLDEYESTDSNTGIWSLDPASGELSLLQHAPSGSFDPIVDSFGRVVFTRWDHLQRDQQADADALNGNPYGTFNYADESAGAALLDNRDELFPEPRPSRTDLLAGTNLEGHTINHFFPWTVEQDGRSEEVVIHLGRHELHDYFNRSMNDDPNLFEFIDANSGRTNPNSITNFLQIAEDPLAAGTYVGVDAPEFQTHAAGQLIALSAAPGRNPDEVTISYLTDPVTRTVTPDGQAPPAGHSGFYRNPLVSADGQLLASHTSETRSAGNEGSRASPVPRYRFRLTTLVSGANGFMVAGPPLTSGISKSLSYYDPDVLVSYSGELWELDAVEVRSRPAPPGVPAPVLAAPEAQVFLQAGVNPSLIRADLAARGLALMVIRDATTRDGGDHQQPFNLRVPGGVETIGAAGKVYDVSFLQLFQSDQIRGIGGLTNPRQGRRVLAQFLHDPAAVALNPVVPGAPQGSASIALDGSVAAFVPARRALAWQLTEPDATPVVRERYWLTYQPGEIRACDGCHGVNTANQAGGPAAQNPPQALADLLAHWKLETGAIFSNGFESGGAGGWAAVQNR